ncbi:hypothetical protein L6164_019068 [Bauhinia variegata]|nr:hypothetical protein L6164_019068 [Bauhinia variegata]
MAINAANPSSSPRASRTPRSQASQQTSTPVPTPRTSRSKPSLATTSSSDPSTSYTSSAAYSSSTGYRLSSDTSTSSRTSLTTLRDSLPENPHIYHFSEICSATNNFLAKRYSSSSSSTPSWRCTLRGRDAIVFQRKFRRKIETNHLKERLSLICRSHHISIIKLLGASISGEHIYLVYEFVNGANLSDCLRNSKNPNFTVLSTWLSRMQVATDLAHGLDYIHNKTGLNISFVHNNIKSSGIIVTEPSFNAKICHFGTTLMCGEIDEENEITKQLGENTEDPSSSPSLVKRSGNTKVQFQGVRGYMSPEFQSTGVATQKDDVYAFGVVVLELLSGEEPLKYKFDKKTGDFIRKSVIDTARVVIEGGSGGGDGGSRLNVEGRLRNWLDRRLKDSFPVQVAEKLTRVALDCVHVDPEKRLNMGRVVGKISKLYLESRIWSDNMRMPTDISVSLAAR